MFTAFFAAIRRLTAAAESLASAMSEADSRFRANVLEAPEQPALPAPEEASSVEPARTNGRKRVSV